MQQKVLGGSGWLQKPAFYPVFAEYTESSESNDEAILDTGTLLRAFLPFQDQQTRRNVHSYSGRATVTDARVACMRPQLEDTRLHSVTDGPGYYVALTATVSTSGSPRGFKQNITSKRAYPFSGGTSPIGCLLQPLGLDNLSSVSLCQINQPGGLFSAFGQMGTVYMVLNFTSESDLTYFYLSADNLTEIISPGIQPTSSSGRREWLDIQFPAATVNKTGESNPYRLSVTVCYTGFDSADLPVKIVSSMNRTEPEPQFDAKSYYSFGAVRHQLGQKPDGSWASGNYEQRGILELQELSSWNPNVTHGAYVRPWGSASWLTDQNSQPIFGPVISPFVSVAKFEGPQPTAYETDISDAAVCSPVANYTAFLNRWDNFFQPQRCRGEGRLAECGLGYIIPNAIYTQLGQEILMTGGDIAHMLSSLFTVLSGAAYYDQLVQFDDEAEIERSTFILTLVPRRYRGFIAVVVVTAIHLGLLAVCSSTFASKTSVSRLNNAWQTLAQISDPAIHEVFSESALASDKEVVGKMTAKSCARSESNGTRRGSVPDHDLSVAQDEEKAFELGPYTRVRIAPSADGKGTKIVPVPL